MGRKRIARVEAGERRGADRHLTVLQLATVEQGGTTQLCLVVNVSRSGLKIRTYGGPPLSGDINLSLRGEKLLSGQIVWSDGETYGVDLSHSMSERDLRQVIAPGGGKAERAPRLSLARPVSVRLGAKIVSATLRNITPAGAMLESVQPARCREGVTISLPGGGLVRGQVRWASEQTFGVLFNDRLPLRAINQLLFAEA